MDRDCELLCPVASSWIRQALKYFTAIDRDVSPDQRCGRRHARRCTLTIDTCRRVIEVAGQEPAQSRHACCISHPQPSRNEGAEMAFSKALQVPRGTHETSPTRRVAFLQHLINERSPKTSNSTTKGSFQDHQPRRITRVREILPELSS